MSVPPVPQVFESGLRKYPLRSGYLDTLIRQQLDVISKDLDMNTPPPSCSDPEDLVAEIGDYFARTANVWAKLSERLSHGPHIDQASLEAHERSRAVSRMSDLTEVTRLDVHVSKLRRIMKLSLDFSRAVEEAWLKDSTPMKAERSSLPTSIPSFCNTKMPSASEKKPFIGDSDPLQLPPRKLLPDNSRTIIARGVTDVSPSEDSCDEDDDADDDDDDDDDDDEEEHFQLIDMDALKQRGKGHYICPKRFKCDKGGVNKDGKLVIFDRNSSFAQHCNKHRKPWRCNIPGCPNPPKKRRFARRDGLERHKSTVKHYAIK